MKEFTLPYSKKKATLNDAPLTGGSCDFSIANVRIINNDLDTHVIIIPYLYHEVAPKSTKKQTSIPDCLMCEIYVDGESSKTVEVPLYKGLYIYENIFSGSSITGVDGDITFDYETNVLEITGDGSITISNQRD